MNPLGNCFSDPIWIENCFYGWISSYNMCIILNLFHNPRLPARWPARNRQTKLEILNSKAMLWMMWIQSEMQNIIIQNSSWSDFHVVCLLKQFFNFFIILKIWKIWISAPPARLFGFPHRPEKSSNFFQHGKKLFFC